MTTTATRSTKNETITRSIAIAIAANGSCVASVTEAHHRKTAPKMLLDTYFLKSIVSRIGGTAIEVEKLGESEVHHVLLAARGNGHTCDCKWGTYKSHVKACRHVEMCLQSIQEGKIVAAAKQPGAKQRPEVCGCCGEPIGDCDCFDNP